MTRARTNDKSAANVTADTTGTTGAVAVIQTTAGEPISNYGNFGRGLCGKGLFGGPVENYIPGETE